MTLINPAGKSCSDVGSSACCQRPCCTGTFRVYNVGQDTQFCPGGDEGTSYMYETARAAAADGPWVAGPYFITP